jgi:thymidylate synthase ThyX
LTTAQLSDADAFASVMNPAQNKLLGETLSLMTLSKIHRALELVTVSFQRKISHTADSQAQRHRMTPGVRPQLTTHLDVDSDVDVITPVLLLEEDAVHAKRLYDDEVARTWDDMRALHAGGVPADVYSYLLPNSFPIRYIETGSLLDQQHKWTTRLCYNAQEEIWRATLEEVEQVSLAVPSMSPWLLPPCGQRKLAGNSPYCPEGDRFCGVPVWNQPRSSYLRVL